MRGVSRWRSIQLRLKSWSLSMGRLYEGERGWRNVTQRPPQEGVEAAGDTVAPAAVGADNQHGHGAGSSARNTSWVSTAKKKVVKEGIDAAVRLISNSPNLPYCVS